MSANTNLNAKKLGDGAGLEGLHSSNDPEMPHMTHSATFDNYKRHIATQQ